MELWQALLLPQSTETQFSWETPYYPVTWMPFNFNPASMVNSSENKLLFCLLYVWGYFVRFVLFSKTGLLRVIRVVQEVPSEIHLRGILRHCKHPKALGRCIQTFSRMLWAFMFPPECVTVS